MQEEYGSVRRSLVFRSPEANGEGFDCGIGRTSRRSQGGSVYKMTKESSSPVIRWRKGELIGCGAYGRVYMGMNLDSGELLAIKQVLIAANNVSKEKAQTHVRELEEEVKLLRNLSHRNIVRYLGTAREEEALNILLEFVPGGSIASLLGKFGSFTEPVVRMYTKQLLQGLEYLHKNGIMHRDIKGANILVDNKGCIKLADFGASKQVVELATISGSKSMKGTPYWMAPEVIRQTGHGLSADIWSVGCTVIEMATGKPPWSEQFQEVAALFHIGTTKSHPPIPDHLSLEAKDFLLKCLKKEPNLRPTATELLKHPFVTGEYRDPHPLTRSSALGPPVNFLCQSGANIQKSYDISSSRPGVTKSMHFPTLGSGGSSTGRAFPEQQSSVRAMWEPNISSEMRNDNFFVDEDLNCSVMLDSVGMDCLTKSFNPISEPSDIEDEWVCKPRENGISTASQGLDCDMLKSSIQDCTPENGANAFSFHCGRPPYDDDDEVTESKIRSFLDEKASELKRLQTPLYEEFYNTLNSTPDSENDISRSDATPIPAKCKSPSKGGGTSLGTSNRGSDASVSSGSPAGISSGSCYNPLREVPSPRLNEWRGLLQETQQSFGSPTLSCFERQRIWKEELDQELERKREEMRKRLAANGGKTSSPKDKLHHKERSACATPTKTSF